MWRMAIYAREAPGHAGRARIDRQVARLTAQLAGQVDWRHIATYSDQDPGADRPGLSCLLAEAPGRIDLLVVDGYGRLSPNRQELNALLAHLGGAGGPGGGASTVDGAEVRPEGGESGVG